MQALVSQFRRYFLYAGLFSVAINVLLLAPPLYMLQVFDRVLTSRSEETLLMLTVATLGAILIMAFLDVLRGRLLAVAGVALERTLGPQVLDAILERAARRTDLPLAGASRDVAALRAFLGGAGVIALFDAPWLPLFLIIIFLFHPLLGVAACVGAALMLLLAIANERMTRRLLEQAQAKSRNAARFVDGAVRNAEVVRALGMNDAVLRRWNEINDAALHQQLSASGIGGRFAGFTRFTRQCIQTAMLALGAFLVVDQHVTAGIMMAATIILGRALGPVEALVAGWRSLVEVRSAWRRVREVLDKAAPQAPATELPAPRGRLAAERVNFAVAGAERPILRGISFALAPGESLGIIGPSAAGKSTLARLIVGVWKPTSGIVRLDGADVAAWPRERLGPLVGYLPQDVELFGGTVAENIARLGEPDAAAVIQAAQQAHVHELILRLPKGYDSDIGEHGERLSPGQCQRIALARALYGQPRIVVLDEPNANLDHDGEEALMRTLRLLNGQGITTVIIAHRPSLLAGVDKMLVLRDGAVDMYGSRTEIMGKVTRAAVAARDAAA
jgi:PrtD family type I secretion system ABC transporter